MEAIGRELFNRAFGCPTGYYYSNGRCYRRSGWYYWGRWVVAGVIIFLVIFLCATMACINSRRRRKRGLNPMYGTGWMAPNSKYGGPHPPNQQWASGYGNNAPPPPPYGGPPQQQYGGSPYGQPPPQNADFGQTEGVQQPPNAYHGVYSPPPGPPPGQK